MRDSRGMRPTWSAYKQIAFLRQDTGFRLTPFRLKLFTAFYLIGNVYSVICFSSAITWMWTLLFHTSHLFPGMMTSQRGIFIAVLSICPLRIWLGMRRRSRRLATQ